MSIFLFIVLIVISLYKFFKYYKNAGFKPSIWAIMKELKQRFSWTTIITFIILVIAAVVERGNPNKTLTYICIATWLILIVLGIRDMYRYEDKKRSDCV
jgi:tellurite resistance protein TehA-like permease